MASRMQSGPLGAPVKKQLSLRSVMEVIIHQGPVSRARIAKITGLSKQTVSEAMALSEQADSLRDAVGAFRLAR